MATIAPNKTDSVVVLTHQAATHPDTIIGPNIEALTKREATIFMYHGYVSDSAAVDTNPGKFVVQIRPEAGDDTSADSDQHWITIAEYLAKGTQPDEEALTATEVVGSTSIAVASTTGFLVGDVVYLEDTTVLADSEWGLVHEVTTNTAILLVDGLAVQKDSADIIMNDASRFVCPLDLNAVESFRVLWIHEGAAGANGHVKVLAITYDSDNST